MAYTLPTSSDYLTASSGAVTNDVGTFAAWLRPAFAPSAGDGNDLFDASSSAHYIGFKNNGLETYFDGYGGTFDTTGLWSSGAWIHLAFVYNKTGNVQIAYINGGAISISGASGTWGSTALGANFYIGINRTTPGNDGFGGDVAEVATWSVELSAAEIASLAKAFSPNQIRPASLNAYWQLHGNGSPEIDRSRNGNNATLVGSPTKADHPRIYYPTHAQIAAQPSSAAVFTANIAAAATVAAALSVGAGLAAAATGTATATAALRAGAGFSAAVTGIATATSAFAEPIPVGDVSVWLGVSLWRTRVGSITIRDLLNAAPNTCSFEVRDTAPTVGQAVEILIGNGTIFAELLFSGSIVTVDQIYEGRPENLAWRVNCQDHTRTINRRKVRKRYAQQSATAIALDLIANYTTGFTTAGVVAGLPTVTGGIDYTEEDVLTCLTRLASRIGGYSDVDYEKDVRLFLTEASDAPDPLEAGYRFLDQPAITPNEDLSQIRTRVYVEGGGAQARNAVAVGATSIPVTDASWYSGTGGVVVSGPQRITYTGKGEVGGPAAPSAAQSLVVGNLGSGAYTYKVSLIDSGVEYPLSVASTAVTIDPVPAPSSAVTAANGSFSPPSAPTAGAPTSGGLVTIGAHTYATTFVTASGETTPSSSSGSITTRVVPTPSSAPGGSMVAGTAGNLDAGTSYRYKTTFVNAAGETDASAAGSPITVDSINTGVSPPTLTGQAGGSMTNLDGINYKLTFLSALGETAGFGSYQLNLSAGQNSIQLTNIPVSADGRVTGRKLYRFDTSVGGTFHLVATLNASDTSYLDTSAPGGGADAPSVDTASSGRINVTGIATSGDATVTARKVYRTDGGGSTYKLLTTINDNSTTTYADNTADGSLGAAPPGSNNADVRTVAITGIQTGPSGTTSRKLYRTEAGGSQLKFLATISGNVTTTYNDTLSDGSLGANAPTTNTAGGALGTGTYGWKVTYVSAAGETTGNTAGTASITTGSAALTSVPVSADARVTARNIYRTTVGGSTYLFEGTISDNSTTTFNSAGSDASLGSAIPTTNTTAAGKINLTSIATGGGGVSARKLYRTVSGGATYKLVATINDNVTTTHLDNIADGSLGVIAPGDIITALTGIPASGPGSVLYEITISSDVNILEQCDDATAQAALAAMEGGDSDGIYEHFIQDRRLASAEARATGNAELALFAYPIITLRYATHDPKTRSGKTIHVDLPSLNLGPTDFTIQSVTIDQIGTASVPTWPRYTVEASSVRFSLEDVLRRLQLTA